MAFLKEEIFHFTSKHNIVWDTKKIQNDIVLISEHEVSPSVTHFFHCKHCDLIKACIIFCNKIHNVSPDKCCDMAMFNSLE